jgi:hypothetical protein
MESLLLTLDVACVMFFLRNVLRAIKSDNPEDLGIFRFTETLTLDKSEKIKSGVMPRA